MFGVVERPEQVWIVSKWMENGNLTKYLSKRKYAGLNRLQLVRSHIIPSLSSFDMICSSWTFARACSTCTRRGLPMVISRAYVRRLGVLVGSHSELCLRCRTT